MTKDFDLLAQLAAFGRANGIPLTEPDIADRFAADAAVRLRAAVGDRNLVYGMRTERLFEALVITLGKYRLLKSEDNGRVHCSDGLRAPDFRVVLQDGKQWLVEVKNVHREDPLDQVHTMEPGYLASLQGYAQAVGVPLFVAHFWSTWGLWTLVEADRFTTEGGGLRIEMADALPHSRLGDLGDVSIGLSGPLELIAELAPGAEVAGPAASPSRVNIRRDGISLTDPRDRKLATILLQYGDWALEGPIEEECEKGTKFVHFRAAPEEPSDNGFDGIGFASRIFSRFYRAETSAGDQVTQLHGEPQPEWFQPLAEWDFSASKLDLRIFRYRARGDDPIRKD